MNISSKKILICDDSILVCKQLKDTINEISDGAIFFEGKNGEDAIKLYKKYQPDIVFLDIVMPRKDGISAIQEIMAYNSSAVIIVVSSVGTKKLLKAAIEAGAKDFIQKPFDSKQIQKLITTHLGGN